MNVVVCGAYDDVELFAMAQRKNLARGTGEVAVTENGTS
jgi:hypothetical protein